MRASGPTEPGARGVGDAAPYNQAGCVKGRRGGLWPPACRDMRRTPPQITGPQERTQGRLSAARTQKKRWGHTPGWRLLTLWGNSPPAPPYLIYNKEIVFQKRGRPQDIVAKNHPQNFVKNYEKNLKKALTHTGVLLYDSQAPVKGAVCDDVGDCSETR